MSRAQLAQRLAEKLGVIITADRVRSWERGIDGIPDEALKAWAQILLVKPEQITER